MNKLKSKKIKVAERTTTTKTTRAFTLLEMLLVIAMIAILAGIVIVAINPGRQLAQARNTQRASDLRALNSAVNQYYIDNRAWPAGLDQVNTLTEICNTGAEGVTHSVNCAADGLIDLSMLVPTYISAIPRDPQVTASLPFINTANAQTTSTSTGYKIAVKENSETPTLYAVNSLEYDQDVVGISIMNTTNTCGDPLIDIRDGQAYNTVKIGNQCWMQENLNIGTRVQGDVTMSNNNVIEKYCYGNTDAGCDDTLGGFRYGGLYQWDEAMQYVTTEAAQGICPTGWHIPNHTEFTTLERSICELLGNSDCDTTFPDDTITIGYLGTTEGTYMKNMNEDWRGLLAGIRSTSGGFSARSAYAYFWSSVEDGTDVWLRSLDSGFVRVRRHKAVKDYGFSVRCLKN